MAYESTECKSCGAAIIWAVTGSGAREPIDAEPVPDGNVEFSGATAIEGRDGWETAPLVRHLKKGEAESPTLFEPPARYKSHFATCPNAARHRRR